MNDNRQLRVIQALGKRIKHLESHIAMEDAVQRTADILTDIGVPFECEIDETTISLHAYLEFSDGPGEFSVEEQLKVLPKFIATYTTHLSDICIAYEALLDLLVADKDEND